MTGGAVYPIDLGETKRGHEQRVSSAEQASVVSSSAVAKEYGSVCDRLFC